jgi:hypothetical protein
MKALKTLSFLAIIAVICAALFAWLIIHLEVDVLGMFLSVFDR